MQALRSGLQLRQAWGAIDHLDSELEKKLDYAFDGELGYLTACPTNLGTGIRVSAMLHLPGLVLGEQINPIIQSVNRLGLAVRGLYGEGTEALGNVFQVSNQMTLGETETTIVERLEKVLAQIIEHEENARQTLLEKKPKVVFNHIGRAYGILANAHSISSKETMNLLSLMRLGVDMGLFPGRGTVAGGRAVHFDAAGAFAETILRQTFRRGARFASRRHGARAVEERQPAGDESNAAKHGELKSSTQRREDAKLKTVVNSKKRKIAYADLDELNGEPIGKPGAPVKLDFLPSPEQVRQGFRTVKVTVSLEPSSLDYYRRQAKRRRETPAEVMRRVLQAHALDEV